MKRYSFLIFAFVTILLHAQGFDDMPRVKEMLDKKWQFISQKAELTEQEATKAHVYFLDYEEKVWRLMEKNKPFYMNRQEGKKNDSPDYRKMNEDYVNIEIQKAQLLKAYYQKLRNVVSEEKIFRLNAAERSFRKEIVRDWQDRKRGPNR